MGVAVSEGWERGEEMSEGCDGGGMWVSKGLKKDVKTMGVAVSEGWGRVEEMPEGCGMWVSKG